MPADERRKLVAVRLAPETLDALDSNRKRLKLTRTEAVEAAIVVWTAKETRP